MKINLEKIAAKFSATPEEVAQRDAEERNYAEWRAADGEINQRY